MNSSASFLWVHVKEARISEPDPNNRADVQVSVQVGSLPPFVTAKSPSPNPKWNEDVMLTVSDENMMESLCVEVFKPKFLFRRELLGKTSLPMVSIRHSNKPREGFWVNLFLPSGTGSNMPTQHQIKLDTHFELPKDIPADVIELLEKKLETFNEVLEEETEVLETQEHRIITGALTPPPSLSCEALDKLEEVAPMEGELEEQLTEEIREESVIAVQAEMLSCANPYMDAGDRLDTDVLTYEERETSPSSHEDTPPIPHKDTPPFPQEDLTDGGSGDVRLSSDELDVPLEFENFEWSRRDSTDSAQLVQQRQQQQRRQQQLQESEEFRRSSMPAVVVTNLDGHNEGAAASGYRKRPSVDSALASVSHGAGVRSLGGSVESIPFQLNDSSRAKANWKLAFTKMLPEVKKNIVLNKPSLFGFSTLSQLVDQLQSVKTKSKLIVEQNIGTFSTVNSQFRTRSRSVLDVKKRMLHRKHFLDERVKMDVYKRALEALLYPASEPDSHMFEMWSARKPTTCSECNYLLWGLKKQGVKCTRCGKVCHERCASLSIQDCFVHDQHSAIQDKMHRMLVNHANRFETVQQAFSVSKEDHTIIKDEVESRILKMADNFNAEIKISVLSAQSLVIPKNLSQRIYVSVSVGDEKKKTEVFKRKEDDKNPPTWDEEFIFNCNNYHDAIQLRVWNERDSAMAKVATRFTKEGDLFLGQKIIEVRRVGASQEVWYKLEKRTEKGPDVSGHIKVNISVNVEGESSTPFHQQYIKLHEQLFFHCHVNNEKDLIIVPSKMSPGDVPSSCPMQLLPPIAQEVVDEFALRYAIEPIFRMMIHIELLVNHHSIQKALVVINNMLKNLKYQMFVHIAADHTARAVGATTLMEEYMDASNFGRDKFSKLLDKLLNSLRLDLQQYREFYPHKDEQKLSELVDTFELLATVIEFQQQAMGILTTGKANELILHAMKECLKNTFDFIVQSNMNEEFSGHPALDPSRTPFDFFYQSIIQIKSVILEDRTVYGKYIPKFCKVNFGDISAVELWHLFSSTIEGLFENNANLEVFSPNEYITLLFTLKSFYDAELKHISSRQGKVPEYPHWFVHPVKRWLQHQYQKEGMVFLNNAWDDDKNRLRFASHENQKLSSSTFQMFFYLHQGLEFVLSLELADSKVKDQHYEDFSMVIINIVRHYVDNISTTILDYTSDLKTMCMLLNNLQAFRSNIQSLFDEMGGTESAGKGASHVLTDFQQVLSKELTAKCVFVAKSLHRCVIGAIKTMQDSLIKIKGQGSIEREEAKDIVKPLFDLLAEKLSTIAVTSEQFVLQKLVKEVWYVCVECLHHMLLPMLKWEYDSTPQGTPSRVFPLHHFTNRQCMALELVMDLLRDFFKAAESQGIKMTTIDRGIRQLKGVIALYRETTEKLITDYIVDETREGVQDVDVEASSGEVFLAVDAFCHPNSGELDGTIRVVSASGLKGFSGTGTLRPLVELNLVNSTSSSHKKKFVTSVSKASYNPNFNETFKFTLTNWEASELMILVKHHPTFGKDKIIGVAVTPCNTLNDQLNLTLNLGASLAITDMGQAILNVLSARSFDEFAKEFVSLKTSQRFVGSDEIEETDSLCSGGKRPSASQTGKTGGLLSGFLK